MRKYAAKLKKNRVDKYFLYTVSTNSSFHHDVLSEELFGYKFIQF
jgi:hypothetical protein